MLRLSDVRQAIQNGLSLAGFGYEVTLSARRSPTPDRSAIGKIASNDLAVLGGRVGGLDASGPLPSGLPYEDQLLLRRFYEGLVPLFDDAAREPYRRQLLLPLFERARTPELKARFGEELVRSYLRGGMPEVALEFCERLPSGLGTGAREEAEAAAEASRRALSAAHPEAPAGVVFENRLAFLRHVVEERPELFAGKRILHIAPEPAVKALLESRREGLGASYQTLDAFSAVASVKDDLRELALADGTYDLVFCHHVLEHVLGDERAIAEIHRILAPGGLFFVSVPENASLERTLEWGVADGTIHGHVRMYGRDFPERLSAAGFSVESFTFIERARGLTWHRPYHLARRA